MRAVPVLRTDASGGECARSAWWKRRNWVRLGRSLRAWCQPGLTRRGCQLTLTPVRELSGLSDAVDSRDPAVGLAAVAALRDLVEELEELHVDNARALGWSWQAIAEALGITRQSVHKKHHVRRRRGR